MSRVGPVLYSHHFENTQTRSRSYSATLTFAPVPTRAFRTDRVIPSPTTEMRAAAVLYLLLHNSVVRPALLSFGYNA